MCDYEYKFPGRGGEPCPYNDRMKYGLVKWEDKKYCIFHAPLETKKNRIDVFWDKFLKLVKQLKDRRLKEWDFEGFVFPDTGDNFKKYKFPEKTSVNFRYTVFSGAVDFSWAQFSQKADFMWARFSREVDFFKARFSREADFFKARFSGWANFSWAQFSGEADFSDAQFSGEADFRKAQFSGDAGFREAQFSREADFSEAQFSGEANLFGAQFSGKANFSWVQFSREADFERTQFFGKADFKRAQFSREVNFRETQFSGEANLFGAKFSGEVNFIEAKFSGEVNFIGARFSRNAKLSGAQFSREADFSESQFSGEAALGGAKFSGLAYFGGAKFSREADFSWAQFPGDADFREAQFSREANFSWAQFSREADFRKAKFSGEADFREAQFSQKADFRGAQFSGEADFGGGKFSGMVYFSRAQFSEKVVFDRTIFLYSLSFNDARFLEVLSFTEAKLGSEVDFSSADLHSQVDFRGADVGGLDCSGAVFRIPPYFGDVGVGAKVVCIKNLVGELTLEFKRGWRELYIDKLDVKNKTIEQKEEEKAFELVILGGNIAGVFSAHAPLKKIDLRDVTFKSTVNLHPNSKDKPALNASSVNFLGDVSISNVQLEELKESSIASSFRLADSDLSRAKFSSVDLTRIDFDNVTWTKVLRRRSRILCRWFKKPDGLYDEVELGNKKTKKDKSTKEEMYYAPNLRKTLNDEKDDKKRKKIEDEIKRLEEMYRQVASSYEARRRFGLAGHFKAGEFEVRRQRKETSGLERFILVCYRWISFYGEEVIKPLLLLLILLPIVSAFFFLWVVGGWHPSWEVIRNFNSDGFEIWSAELPQNFSQALTCGFQGLIPTFNYLTDYPGLISTIIGLAEKLFAALFTSLFLFALRRRVKR